MASFNATNQFPIPAGQAIQAAPNGARLLVREQSTQCNKLQANKSSFQAWKSISFGCSLMALFLIGCKWREVSNDLSMLIGIERMLTEQHQQQHPPSTTLDHHQHQSLASMADLSTEFHLDAATTITNNHNKIPGGPVASDKFNTFQHVPPAHEVMSLAERLSLLNPIRINSTIENTADNKPNDNNKQHNTTTNAPDTGEPNPESIIRDQMHLFLSQEFNANHLLRLEIELFTAEFRSSKSTLLLSLILLAIYIVSWMLMSLAIKDTRISNDISVRNILLLSIFGVIDIAASVSFIMVRLVMYSVKNNPFASDLLEAVGLKDSPIKLSADQTTAFAALRLIGMRSSAANVDLYVGSLVGVVTILRLYAIARALNYYRHLRRLGNCQHLAASHSLLTSSLSPSAATSRRSSLNEPLGLQMSHQFAQVVNERDYNQRPHSYQVGTSAKTGLLWSPQVRPGSYNLGSNHINNNNNNLNINNESANNNQLVSSSYINLNPNIINEKPLGASHSGDQLKQESERKFLIIPNSSNYHANEAKQQMSDAFVYTDYSTTTNRPPANDAIVTISRNATATGGRRQRRHASVEAIRSVPGSDLLLVQAAPLQKTNTLRNSNSTSNQQTSRHLTASRRQRASSSPRLVNVSVNPGGNQEDNDEEGDLAELGTGLSAQSLLRRQQYQLTASNQRDCDQVASLLVNSKKSRKSVPPTFEVLHSNQHHQQDNKQQEVARQDNKKLANGQVGVSKTRTAQLLTRSSLQDLIFANYQPQKQAVEQHTNVSANENTIESHTTSSPIKALKTLRNKNTQSVAPTLYTLLNPMLDHKQHETTLMTKNNVVNNSLSNRQPGTRYKLVARYRQMGSLDSSAATRTLNTTSADSATSSSSSPGPPDDSDGSIATNELPLTDHHLSQANTKSATSSKARRAMPRQSRQVEQLMLQREDGMRHSDEFVTSSSPGTGHIAKAQSLGRKQQKHNIVVQSSTLDYGDTNNNQTQQSTIVMSGQDDGNSSDNNNEKQSISHIGDENVFMGKYYYYT